MTEISPTPDAHPPVTVRRASQAASPAFDDIVALCEGAVAPESLHFIAYYEGGVLDFSVSLPELLDSATDPGLFAGGDVRLDGLERLGRQLNYVHTRLDHALAFVRSGQLIRMTLRYEAAVVVYYLVTPGEYVVACRLDPSIDGQMAADGRIARLVDGIRRNKGLLSMNPGGFATELAAADFVVGSDEEYRPVTTGDGVAHAEVLALCEPAIQPDDVHHIAYFHKGRFAFSTDLLDNPALAPFFRRITPAERRQRYSEIGSLLHLRAKHLNTSLLRRIGGPLRHLVADVEEGALYYLHLQDDDFLVGATLDQTHVAVTDGVLRAVARSVLAAISAAAENGAHDGSRIDAGAG